MFNILMQLKSKYSIHNMQAILVGLFLVYSIRLGMNNVKLFENLTIIFCFVTSQMSQKRSTTGCPK